MSGLVEPLLTFSWNAEREVSKAEVTNHLLAVSLKPFEGMRSLFFVKGIETIPRLGV